MTHLPVGAVILRDSSSLAARLPVCHSERSEESVPPAAGMQNAECKMTGRGTRILRVAQNDRNGTRLYAGSNFASLPALAD